MGHKFFPGDPRIGRKKLPEDLRAIRCRSKSEIKRLLNMYLDFPRDQLQKKHENPKTPAIEVYLSAMIMKGIRDADWRMFAFLMDRIVGPVQTQDTDVAELRAQIESELRLDAMPIEDVRAVATGMITIEAGDDE